jgi:hypothetical protein
MDRADDEQFDNRPIEARRAREFSTAIRRCFQPRVDRLYTKPVDTQLTTLKTVPHADAKQPTIHDFVFLLPLLLKLDSEERTEREPTEGRRPTQLRLTRRSDRRPKHQ